MWFHIIKPVLTDIKTCAMAAIAPAGSMRHSKPSHPTERREDGSLIHTRNLSIGIAIEWRRPLPVLDNPNAAHRTGRPVAGPPSASKALSRTCVCFLPAGYRRCPTMIRRAEADIPKAAASGIGPCHQSRGETLDYVEKSAAATAASRSLVSLRARVVGHSFQRGEWSGGALAAKVRARPLGRKPGPPAQRRQFWSRLCLSFSFQWLGRIHGGLVVVGLEAGG